MCKIVWLQVWWPLCPAYLEQGPVLACQVGWEVAHLLATMGQCQCMVVWCSGSWLHTLVQSGFLCLRQSGFFHMVQQLDDCFTCPCIHCLEPLAQSVQQSLNHRGARSSGTQLLQMGDLCQEIFNFPQMAHTAGSKGQDRSGWADKGKVATWRWAKKIGYRWWRYIRCEEKLNSVCYSGVLQRIEEYIVKQKGIWLEKSIGIERERKLWCVQKEAFAKDGHKLAFASDLNMPYMAFDTNNCHLCTTSKLG